MAFVVVGRVESLEDPEQLLRKTHIEPDAVVADGEYDLVRTGTSVDLDLRGLALARELEGVADQVGEDEAHHVLVGAYVREVAHLHLALQLRETGCHFVADFLH